MVNHIIKKVIKYISLILLVFLIIFLNKQHSCNQKLVDELGYAQYFFSKGLIKKALNENGDKKYLGFLGISDKFYHCKEGNISKFYAGICYFRLKKYIKCIEVMNNFYTNNEILLPMKYGIIGDSYLQINDLYNALENYIIAANIKINNLTTPLYSYKVAILSINMKKYDIAKHFLIQIHKYYPTFLYKDNVEKYIYWINNIIE